MFLQKLESRNRCLHIVQDMDRPDGGHDGPQVEKRWKEHLGFEGHDEGNVWRTAKAPGDATTAINGKEDLWNPPPGRESQLEVVKKGLVYDLRAYRGEKKKPSKLYEDEDDLRYQAPPEEASIEKAKELEEERREIIRNQAVKKRITIAERWSSVEHLEDSPARNVTKTGSDVCFNNSSSRRTSMDPQNVDTEKIDFTTARQQFLELEKKNPKLLLRSNKPRNVGHGDELQGPPAWEDTSLSDAPHQGRLGGSHERMDLLVWSRKGPSTQVQDPSGGNQPSCLEKPPWEVKTMKVDGGGSSRHSGELLHGPDPVGEEEEETPIEREIRLAQEREEDLWKERGIIPKANAREELVQIQTRPLLSASVSSWKGKEKRPVSFHFQREMEQETRREEALLKEGRLLGTYSKGETQELAQRRRVFEQPKAETPPGKQREPPNGDDSLTFRDPSLKNHVGGGTENQERKWTSEEDRLTASTPKFGQERLKSLPHKMSHPLVDLSDLTPPSSPGSVLRKEHFVIPVGKLRFSFARDQETARDRRNQLASGAPREEPYILKTWKPQTSALIDQEIQEALEREEELKEQRRKVQVVPDSRMSSQSSAASGVAGSYSVSMSPVFSPMLPPPWQAFPEWSLHKPDPKSCLSPSRRRREDGKYAGIKLSDEIDTEVVQSTKPICRRGVLAQLWESGQIPHIDDDVDDDNQA